MLSDQMSAYMKIDLLQHVVWNRTDLTVMTPIPGSTPHSTAYQLSGNNNLLWMFYNLCQSIEYFIHCQLLPSSELTQPQNENEPEIVFLFFTLFGKQHCSVPKILFISRRIQGRARNLIKTIEVQTCLGLIQLLGSMNYYIKNVLIIYVNSTPAKFGQYLPKT